MLLLTEISYQDDKRVENKILVNPYLVITVRQPGIDTLLTTVDGQEIYLSDTLFGIKKMLAKYDLSLLDSKVIKKNQK